MSIPVTLRVQQQGYVRPLGHQATQWAVTVPVQVTGDAAPIGTSPLSYAPLFVVDGQGVQETLRRVASLRDFAQLGESELEYFEARGTGGNTLYEQALVGDILYIPGGPAHWLQDQAPYTDHEFTVLSVPNRASGVTPAAFAGSELSLPGYVFTEADVGRWVRLTGFATPSYNGWAQITSYAGSVASVNKTFTANEVGGGWAFPWVKIRSDVGPTLEPRYFPTREVELPWSLHRGSPSVTAPLASGFSGASARAASGLVRSVRFTELAPSLDDALASFEYVRAALTKLQQDAELSGTSFTTLLTVTEGP